MPFAEKVTPLASLISSTEMLPPGSAVTLPMMWKIGSIGCTAFGWHASGSATAAGSGASASSEASSSAAGARGDGVRKNGARGDGARPGTPR